MATDLDGWFTKWLLRCELTDNSTIISISYSTRKLSLRSRLCAFVLGICAISPVFIVASLSRDWWGLANVTSMAVSVVVRQNALAQNREALDAAVAGNKGSLNEEVKVFVTMPTGPAVTIKASRGIVINCLLSNSKPSHKVLYKVVLAIGWVVFGCHVVTIGMTTLVCQILSVALLLVAMLLKTNGFGDAQDHIGTCLSLEKKVASGKDSRAAAYARFDLSQKEEASMSRWNLFPHKSNGHWWEKYRKCTEDKSLKSFYDWDKELPRDSPRLLSKIDVQRRLSA